MRVPRDLAKRIEHIEKTIRKRLGPAVSKEQIRQEIYEVISEIRVREIVGDWEKDWQEMGCHAPEHIPDAALDLENRIHQDPLLERARASPSSWLHIYPAIIKEWARRAKRDMEAAGLGRTPT